VFVILVVAEVGRAGPPFRDYSQTRPYKVVGDGVLVVSGGEAGGHKVRLYGGIGGVRVCRY
jgi:hypothetical protein